MKRIAVGVLLVFVFLFTSGLAEAASSYVVRPGDTAWLIAQRYNTTVEAMIGANGLTDPNYIEVGQRLAIPGRGVLHVVRPGDTVWLISLQYNTTVQAIARENELRNVDYIEVGDRLIIPVGQERTGDQNALSLPLSAADQDLLARLVHAEAAGEPYTGQVAVAATILNRVKSPRYPNTVREVIYQVVNGYYQWSPVLDGRIEFPANERARRAVQDALNGWDPSLGAIGFYNPAKTTNAWVRQQPVTTLIGNHVFFR